jgi:DNA-binding XRE family transcriptional regulator
MPEPSDPQELRKEINAILDKVANRGSLLYFQWMIRLIHKNAELPPPEELTKLHQVFIRITDAFRTKKNVSAADWKMMFKYVGVIGNDLDISRHLASTVKFYRQRAGLTRLQAAKRAGINMKTMLALERGGIKDMSLPRLDQLVAALNVDAGEFMDQIYRPEKAQDKNGECSNDDRSSS